MTARGSPGSVSGVQVSEAWARCGGAGAKTAGLQARPFVEGGHRQRWTAVVSPGSSDRVRSLRSGRRAGNSSLNLRVEPHGQGSLRPNFSSSSLSPWTRRWPRLTWVSDGKPLRRLRVISRVGSKATGVGVVTLHGAPPDVRPLRAGLGVAGFVWLAPTLLRKRERGSVRAAVADRSRPAFSGLQPSRYLPFRPNSPLSRLRERAGVRAGPKPAPHLSSELSPPDASSPAPRPGPCRPCRPAWPSAGPSTCPGRTAPPRRLRR